MTFCKHGLFGLVFRAVIRPFLSSSPTIPSYACPLPLHVWEQVLFCLSLVVFSGDPAPTHPGRVCLPTKCSQT